VIQTRQRFGVSERRACRVLHQPRATQRRPLHVPEDEPRLLEHATLDQLTAAVEHTLAIGALSAEAVRIILQARQERPVGLFCLDGRPHLKLVRVQAPDLHAYRALAGGGA
jgi:hypothetical protein